MSVRHPTRPGMVIAMRWRSNLRENETSGAREQLGWFATLFAMGLTFHYSDSQPLAVTPVLLAGLPALLFPGSAVAAGLVLVAAATVAARSLPAASNHLMLSLLIAFALGGAALWARVTRDPANNADGFVDRWLDGARTPVGLTVLVVYLFTVFDKLNTAYFDPATSCGGELFNQLLWLNGLGAVVIPPALDQFLAVAAVLIEAAILGLLAVPRLRYRGILLGFAFHSVLAWASFYDFATIMFAVYLLLIPRRVFTDLGSRTVLRGCALTGFTVHVLLSVTTLESFTGPFGVPWHTLMVVSWFLAVGPVMLAVLRAYRAAPTAGIETPGWRLQPVVLLLVPALALANGLTPYLGLKTVANYSMFSNLHTEEGRTNHLVPGVTAIALADPQRTTVTLVGLEFPDGTEIPPAVHRQTRWLNEDPPVRIPWLELRRAVLLWQRAGIGGIRIAYLRDGERRVVDDATVDPVLSAPLPWWQRQLLAFRAVDSGWGPDACRW